MDQYFEVFRQSKNFPRNFDAVTQKDIRLQPICPDDFPMISEELVVMGSAIDAIAYVQSATERLSREHTLVFGGERRMASCFLSDYSIAVGEKKSAVFQKDQMREVKKTYKKANGEIVFAHSHVGEGENYNCFSVSDLLFLIKQAITNQRDVYGMLVTKDGAIPIKYSYARNEFFRIRIVVA
jgi:hypothetical protein